MPIVNENDAIASDEIRYGDNDRLAALVSHNMGAALLVLLTDLDGLYTADPRVDADAELIREVAADDPLLSISAGGGGSGRGSGGHGEQVGGGAHRLVVGRADRDRQRRASGVLAAVAAGESVGTRFEARRRSLTARKLWIAFAAHTAGAVIVDDGARRALVERNTSLLPAGVVAVEGSFVDGDTVEVRSTDGTPFARGMVFVDAAQLRKIKGMHTRDLPDGVVHEVIHRDDLVVMPR